MTERSVVHSTFNLERFYPAPVTRVFGAWADPAAKARWFSPNGPHELDFRVGGRELNRFNGDAQVLTFESHYHDIVIDQRVAYTSTLSVGDNVVTVSLTTVEFTADGDGDVTRLVLTEHGAFLDGHEQPTWREQGTGAWLDALGAELQSGPGSGANLQRKEANAEGSTR
jgi:uncharacterized protein YndB with AHSA1/START domain